MLKFKDGMRVRVVIGKTEVTAEVVVSQRKRNRGLAGRDGLADGCGMLFIYVHDWMNWSEEDFNFWNKGMCFPIDIIWIDDGKVVGTFKNLPAYTGKPVRAYPQRRTTVVLEVNAGFVKQHGIKRGCPVGMFLR